MPSRSVLPKERVDPSARSRAPSAELGGLRRSSKLGRLGAPLHAFLITHHHPPKNGQRKLYYRLDGQMETSNSCDEVRRKKGEFQGSAVPTVR